MTLTVDYQPIANGGGANVESQAQYLIDLAVSGSLVNGYQSGLAKSNQINKTLRQSSMIAAAVANFVANTLSSNILDDGNLTTLTTNLTNAVIAAGSTVLDQATAGANHTFATADNGYITRRSNSGSAMTDTLPGTSGALAVGWSAYVENTDTTAADVIGVGGGGTINQGLNTGSITILPGEIWFIESRGTGIYNAWRVASSTLLASPEGGAANNLVVTQASNTTVTVTIAEIVLEDASGNTRRVLSASHTLNCAGTGANGLDTGALATSTFYYVFEILNPTTNTSACVASVTAPSANGRYAGANMPSGYVFSRLISSFMTDGSSHILPYWQYGRSIYFAAVQVLSGGASASYAAVSLTAVVPPIGRTISGYCITHTGTAAITIAGSAAGLGQMNFAGPAAGVSGGFSNIPVLGSQQIFYLIGASTTGDIFISGYTF